MKSERVAEDLGVINLADMDVAALREQAIRHGWGNWKADLVGDGGGMKKPKSICVIVRTGSGPCFVCKERADPVHVPNTDPIRILCGKCCPCRARLLATENLAAG
jgi:hypothetical protein